MSDHDTMHHADAHDAGHDTAHGADDAGHDAHGHDQGTLGPIDWPMWGAGALGVILAVVVVVAVALATGFVFSA